MHRITGDDSYIADTRHKSAATYLTTQQIFTAHETCRSLLVLCSNGHFSRWTWISRYHNVFILDFIGAKDDGDGGDNSPFLMSLCLRVVPRFGGNVNINKPLAACNGT